MAGVFNDLPISYLFICTDILSESKFQSLTKHLIKVLRPVSTCPVTVKIELLKVYTPSQKKDMKTKQRRMHGVQITLSD